MKFSDFFGYDQIKTNKESSEWIGLSLINLDILRTLWKNQKFITDICGKKSANGTKFNIGGDFRQCRYMLISSDGSGVDFHWALALMLDLVNFLIWPHYACSFHHVFTFCQLF